MKSPCLGDRGGGWKGYGEMNHVKRRREVNEVYKYVPCFPGRPAGTHGVVPATVAWSEDGSQAPRKQRAEVKRGRGGKKKRKREMAPTPSHQTSARGFRANLRSEPTMLRNYVVVRDDKAGCTTHNLPTIVFFRSTAASKARFSRLTETLKIRQTSSIHSHAMQVNEPRRLFPPNSSFLFPVLIFFFFSLFLSLFYSIFISFADLAWLT